jgi:hypothetical protein
MQILEVIKRARESGFQYDHEGHQVLYNAALSIKEVPGMVCEIGLREGGGMMTMILGCMDNADTNRFFVAVDPYGNVEYRMSEWETNRYDYTDEMKFKTLKSFNTFCLEHKLQFQHICLDDLEFFKRYGDGIPVYVEVKHLEQNYALVHLDGPHAVNELIDEFNFFKDRISLGGIIVLDDVTGHYDLGPIQKVILGDGQYAVVDNDSKKASYKRIK